MPGDKLVNYYLMKYKGKNYSYKLKPTAKNVMSYHGCPMPQTFSKKQVALMHSTLKHATP